MEVAPDAVFAIQTSSCHTSFTSLIPGSILKEYQVRDLLNFLQEENYL